MSAPFRLFSRACCHAPSGLWAAVLLFIIGMLAPMEGPALQISPANVVVAVGESLALIASGGTPPYTFAMVTSNSGGSVDPASGVYTAGSTAGVSDTVRVTDAVNASVFVVVLVSAPPFVQESFEGIDYENGAPLPGLNGGFGFAAPWTDNGNSLLVANIDFGSYPTFGQGARTQTGSQGVRFTRLLAPGVFPASGQTFWLSYLVSNRGRRADSLVHIDRRFSTGMDSFENPRMKLDLDLDAAAPDTSFVDVPGAGLGPFLVVARFENFNSGGPENPQTGTLWILTAANYEAIGNTGFTEAALEANNTARLTQSTASAIGFTEGILNVGGFSGTTPVFDFDEIKLGPTFASVLAAFTPQPGPLSISPTDAIIVARETQSFTASGGSPPYNFSLVANNSGASINSASGLYTAGSTANVTDTVRVTDALDASASATVNVTPQMTTFHVQTLDGDFGALAGVAIAVTGSASANGVTDSSGQFTLSLPVPGTYTFTPSQPQYIFTPPFLSVTDPTTATVNLTFIGRLHRFSIRSVVAGGGGGRASVPASLNGLSVLDTMGQPDASGPLTNAQFSLVGGFWALPIAVQTTGAPTLTIVRAAPGFATISWNPSTPGFHLQVSDTLNPPAWADAPSGINNPVTVPATLPVKFYRLIKP